MSVLNTFIFIALKLSKNVVLHRLKPYPAGYKEGQGCLMLLYLCPHMAPAGHKDMPVWAWNTRHLPDLKSQSNSNSYIGYLWHITQILLFVPTLSTPSHLHAFSSYPQCTLSPPALTESAGRNVLYCTVYILILQFILFYICCTLRIKIKARILIFLQESAFCVFPIISG